MKTQFQSSLDCQVVLRASSDTIEAICISPLTGNMVTFDKKAARLWVDGKQIKSFHWKEGYRKFITAKWLPNIDVILVIFEYSTDGESPKQTIIQVWSSQLIQSQEMQIKCIDPVIVSFSPNEMEIVLIESKMVAIVLKLTVEESTQPNKLPLFPKERDRMPANDKYKVMESTIRAPVDPLKPTDYVVVPIINIVEIQRFDCPMDIKDCKYIGMDDIVMLGTEVLYYLQRKTLPVDGGDKAADSAGAEGGGGGGGGGGPDDDARSGASSAMTDNIDTISHTKSIGLGSGEEGGGVANNKDNKKIKKISRADVQAALLGNDDDGSRASSRQSQRSQKSNRSQHSITIKTAPLEVDHENTAAKETKPPAAQSKQLREKPTMVSLFQLQRQLLLRDPNLPVYHVDRVPHRVHVLDPELLCIIWNDGSFDLFVVPKSNMIKKAVSSSAQEAGATEKARRRASVERQEDNISSEHLIPLLTIEAHVKTVINPKQTVPSHVLKETPATQFTASGVADFQHLRWRAKAARSDLYQHEILTAGHDRMLKHWGLRCVALRQDDGSDQSWEADLLGEYAIKNEPRSHISVPAQASPGNLLWFGGSGGAADASTAEAALQGFKSVLCTVGGQILMFKVLQPQLQLLDGGVKDIICSRLGPCIGSLPGYDAGQGSESDRSLLLLRGEQIEAVSPNDGSVLACYSASNLMDQGAEAPKLKSTAVPIATQLSGVLGARAQEGHPCSLHYCCLSRMLLVGYSSGGVGLIPMYHSMSRWDKDTTSHGSVAFLHSLGRSTSKLSTTGLVNLGLHADAYIPSTSAHSGQIMQIVTFKLKSGVFACIADEFGVLSTWTVPASGQHSKLVWRAEAHRGKIIYLDVLQHGGDSTHLAAKLLLTACTTGTVRVWDCRPDGTLRNAASFQLNLSGGSLLQSIAAIPLALVPPTQQVNATTTDTKSLASDLDTVVSGSIWGMSNDDTSSLGSSVYYEPTAEFTRPPELHSIPKPITRLEVVCVCGTSSGRLETWRISTDPNRISLRPIQSVGPENGLRAGVGNLLLSGVNSFRVDEALQFVPGQLADADATQFPLLASVGADILRMQVTGSGALHFQSCLSCIKPVKALFNCRNNNNMVTPDVLEVHTVGETDVSEVLVWAEDVPFRWRRSVGSKSVFTLQATVTRRASFEEDRDFQEPSMASSADVEYTKPGGGVNGTAEANEEGTVVGAEGALRTQLVNYYNACNINISSGDDDASASVGLGLDLSKLQGHGLTGGLPSASQVPAHSVERTINNNLHAAKKDPRLLQIFRLRCDYTTQSLSAQQAADAVADWLGFVRRQEDVAPDGTISVDSNVVKSQEQVESGRAAVWELLRLLGVPSAERLAFIKVAKLAAVAMAAFQMNPCAPGAAAGATAGTGTNKKLVGTGFGSRVEAGAYDCNGKEYQELRSQSTAVTYNAMGERVLTRKKVVQGVVRGCRNRLREVWNQQPPRVITQTECAFEPFLPALLTEMPESLQGRLARGIVPQLQWGPLAPGWMDTRKAVHTARELLAFRYGKQKQLYLSVNENNRACQSELNIEDLSATLVTFFERQLGSGDMGMRVSHQRCLEFLEACHQYMQTPVLNFLRRAICPEVPYERVDDLSIWLYVEAKALLESWGSITQGELVPTAASLGLVPFAPSNEFVGSLAMGDPLRDLYGTTAGPAYRVHWLLVARGDALKCIDVMFRLRGRFGPLAVQRILTVINNIPAAAPKHSHAQHSHKGNHINIPILASAKSNADLANMTELIDLELFLEVLVVEFAQLKSYIGSVDDSVFGDDFFMKNFPTTGSGSNASVDLQVAFNLVEEVRRLVSGLVQYDARRTGLVSEQAFRIALLRFLPPDRNIINGRYVNALIDRCVATYRTQPSLDGEGDGITYVSYSDYWSVLLSWLTQTKLSPDIGVPDLFYGSVVQEGLVEDQHVINIITLIGLMQAPPRLDSFWTCSETLRTKLFQENEDLLRSIKPTGDLLPARAPLQGLLGLDRGEWLVHPKVCPEAATEPGALTIARVIPKPKPIAASNAATVAGSAGAATRRTGMEAELQASLMDKHSRRFADREGIDVDQYPMVPYRPDAGQLLQRAAMQASALARSAPRTGVQFGLNDSQQGVDGQAATFSYSRSIENLVPDLGSAVQSRSLAENAAMNQHTVYRSSEGFMLDSNSNSNINVASAQSGVGGGLSWLGIPSVGVDLEMSSSSTNASQVLVTDHMHVDSHQDNNIGANEESKRPHSQRSSRENESPSQSQRLVLSPKATEVRFVSSPSGGSPVPALHTHQQREARQHHESREVSRLMRAMKHEHHLSTAPDSQYPGLALGGGSVWDQSLSFVLEQEQASDCEVERLRRETDMDEDLFLQRYRMEQQVMGRRLMDKKREEELRLKALREKELAAQLFADEAEKERLRRLLASRDALEKRRLAEEAAKKAQEDEINAKIAAQKARSAKLHADKRAKEDAMQEKVRELNENLHMKAEDAASRHREEHEAELQRIKEYEEQQRAAEHQRQALAAAVAAREAKEREEKAERERQLAHERALEAKEREHMHAEDIDAPVLEEEVPVVKTPSPEPLPPEVEEPEPEVVAPARQLTWAERRILMFLDRLQTAEDLNSRHPRRGDDPTQFFLPLTFSSDIHFNPFQAPTDQKRGQPTTVGDSELEEDVAAPVSNFGDITRRVKHHKISMERERLHLYDTSATEVSPRSWTTLSKTVKVDWEGYLAQEQYNLLRKPDPEPEADDGEEAFAEEMRRTMQQLQQQQGRRLSTMSSKQKSVHSGSAGSFVGLMALGDGEGDDDGNSVSSSGLNVPAGLQAQDFDTAKVVPLPLGRVCKETVMPGYYHYFQLAVVDPDSVLTIELKGIHGLAELYLAQGYLPSSSRYMLKDVNMGKAQEKICRMVLNTAGYTGYVFLAVYSPKQGCRYQLWAATSGIEIGQSGAMAKVSQTVRSLTILANHDDADLAVNFPVLYNEAHNIAEEEAKIQHSSILALMSQASEQQEQLRQLEASGQDDNGGVHRRSVMFSEQHPTLILENLKKFKNAKDCVGLANEINAAVAGVSVKGKKPQDGEDDDDDEFDVLDRFVQKVGRRDIKAELKRATEGSAAMAPGEPGSRFPIHRQGVTPFLHPEVFLQQGMETAEQFNEYAVRPVTPEGHVMTGARHSVATTPHTQSPKSPQQPAPFLLRSVSGGNDNDAAEVGDTLEAMDTRKPQSRPRRFSRAEANEDNDDHSDGGDSTDSQMYFDRANAQMLMQRAESNLSSYGVSPAARDRESIEWDRIQRRREREKRGQGGSANNNNSRSRTSTALSSSKPNTAQSSRLDRFTPLTDDSDFVVSAGTRDMDAVSSVDTDPDEDVGGGGVMAGPSTGSLSASASGGAGGMNAYAELFLSRSTTVPSLPRLPRKDVASSGSNMPAAAAAAAAAAGGASKLLANSKSAPALETSAVGTLPHIFTSASKQQSTATATATATTKQGKKKYDDGLLKQARNPKVVTYTLRKI